MKIFLAKIFLMKIFLAKIFLATIFFWKGIWLSLPRPCPIIHPLHTTPTPVIWSWGGDETNEGRTHGPDASTFCLFYNNRFRWLSNSKSVKVGNQRAPWFYKSLYFSQRSLSLLLQSNTIKETKRGCVRSVSSFRLFRLSPPPQLQITGKRRWELDVGGG